MKTISRKLAFSSLLVAGIFIVSLGVPTAVMAENSRDSTKPAATRKNSADGQQTCSNLNGLSNRLSGQLEDKRGKVQTSRNQRDSKQTDRQVELRKKLTDRRADWDAKRQENFSKLEEKAQTDAQKAAVATYVAAIKKAVTTRRVANDAAATAFQKAVDAAVAKYRSDSAADSQQLKAAIQAAVEKAITNCSTQGRAAFETMKAEIKSARQAYKNARKSDDTLKTQIKQFQSERRAATQAANQAFKDAIVKARDELKQTFTGQNI